MKSSFIIDQGPIFRNFGLFQLTDHNPILKVLPLVSVYPTFSSFDQNYEILLQIQEYSRSPLLLSIVLINSLEPAKSKTFTYIYYRTYRLTSDIAWALMVPQCETLFSALTRNRPMLANLFKTNLPTKPFLFDHNSGRSLRQRP